MTKHKKKEEYYNNHRNNRKNFPLWLLISLIILISLCALWMILTLKSNKVVKKEDFNYF